MSARKHKRYQSRVHGTQASKENYGQLLARALRWLVDDGIFLNLKTHGNTTWMYGSLVSLAVFWVWSDRARLTDAFKDAHRLSLEFFSKVALNSYQGMMGALVSKSSLIVPALWTRLHERMELIAGPHWRIGKWLPLACDGSYFSTPRTKKNEDAFGLKNYGQGKMSKSRKKWKNKRKRSKPLSAPVKPQIWLTLIWHIGLKMPWCWKTAGAYVKEREHFKSMVDSMEFPENTLFCADAGFTGFELWSSMLKAGHHFVIRVGSNVHLLKRLSQVRNRQGLVYLWPNNVARRKQPPMTLRLIKIQDGRGVMYLVTSVLSTRELSDSMAHRLYQLRWGIEIQFRSVKQTFGKRKLKSRTPENALVELEWSLVGLWFIQLLAAKEQIKLECPPKRSSVAMALRTIQEAMRSWYSVVPNKHSLSKQLSQAITDDYQRWRPKAARYKPDYKDWPTRGKPKLKKATAAQRMLFKQLTMAA
jgi:hypothetical protein